MRRKTMKFFKKNIWTICSWIAVFALFAADASAQTVSGGAKSIMWRAQTKAANVFQAVKTITFIIGGFGLVGIAYQAIIGKVKWSWFAGLAVGLALLAAAGSIVEYATGDSVNENFGDSFSKGQAYW